MKSLIASPGIELEYSDDLGSAEGTSHGANIAVRSNLSAAEEFSTLARELAYELLHHTDNSGRLSKTLRETEAFVVSQPVGLDTNSACFDYIQLYCGKQRPMPQGIRASERHRSTVRDPHA